MSVHTNNIGSGKTLFVECMLYEAGAINRRGTIEGQNTVSDYTKIEQERGNSLFSSLMHVQWRDNKINIIDTPGYDDFVGEVIASLKVADTALMMVNASNGVEVGTELLKSLVHPASLSSTNSITTKPTTIRRWSKSNRDLDLKSFPYNTRYKLAQAFIPS
jgi:peptide subunit release factor RF-3